MPDQPLDTTLDQAPIDPALEIERVLDALLDTPWPADWDDPAAVARRVIELEHVAVHAGAAMTEMLVRLKSEQALGTHMAEGGCVVVFCDAVIALHRALVRFSFEVPQRRREGLHLAREAVERAHDVGIADLTMTALAELRGLIDKERRRAWKPLDGVEAFSALKRGDPLDAW